MEGNHRWKDKFTDQLCKAILLLKDEKAVHTYALPFHLEPLLFLN